MMEVNLIKAKQSFKKEMERRIQLGIELSEIELDLLCDLKIKKGIKKKDF